MSHLVKIELEINDLTVLKKACNRLGFSFNENQKQFTWYGRQPAACNGAIHIPNARYEIGVTQKKEGKGYELQCDFFDRDLVTAIGNNGGLLKQAYAIEKGKLEAQKKGYKVWEQKTDAGIKLTIRL